MAHEEATHGHDHGAHDDGAVHAHISPVSFYLKIFAALICFTLLTVGVSYVHLGPANLAVAIVIASAKAALVVTFFMHLNHDSRFNALIFVSSLLFIGVFFAYTFNDTEHRAEVDKEQGSMVLEANGKEAPGGYILPKVIEEHEKQEHAGEAGEKTEGKAAPGEKTAPAPSGSAAKPEGSAAPKHE